MTQARGDLQVGMVSARLGHYHGLTGVRGDLRDTFEPLGVHIYLLETGAGK